MNNIKKLKPTSPGTRHVVREEFGQLTNDKPYKPLVTGLPKTSGRNNQGRITSFHKGGGHKKNYRIVDFKRDKLNIPGRICTIEYDPHRTSFIALVSYEDGEKRYILCPQTLKVGDTVLSGENLPITVGNCSPIGSLALGIKVHNVELRPGKGGQLARSAGTSVKLVNRTDDSRYTLVRLASGETRKILNKCMATVGEVSRPEHSLISLGKAGANRWRGIRPTVRGTAMNSVDHPHGGGEGKTRGKQHKTPWGKITKGKKTRNNKRTDKFIVKRIN
jgi:large subunit ribosomal protein L2